MSEIPKDELISAYFDGELTDEARARAESLLAESEEARRQLDDLRALSQALKAMPQESLDEDLSGKVLRQAERAMLTEGRGSSAATPSSDIEEPLVRRMAAHWRSLVWPVAAIAAALLISVVWNEPESEHGDLAQGPAAAPKASVIGAPDYATDAIAGSLPGRKNAAPAAKDHRDSSKAFSGVAPQADSLAKEFRGKGQAGNETAVDRSVRLDAEVTAKGAAARESDKIAEGAQSSPRFAESRPDGDRLGKSAAVPRTSTQALAPAAGETLIVQVDVSADAARERAFDKLLGTNSIVLEDEEAEAGGGADDRSGEDAAQGLSNDEGATRRDRFRAAHEHGETEVVLVEASPVQVKNALADLAAQSSQFPAVAIQPAPGVLEQQSLSVFNRGSLSQPESRAASLFSLQRGLKTGEDQRRRGGQDASRPKSASPAAPEPPQDTVDRRQSVAKNGHATSDLEQKQPLTAGQKSEKLDSETRSKSKIATSKALVGGRNQLKRQQAIGRARRLALPAEGLAEAEDTLQERDAFQDATALIEQLQRQQVQGKGKQSGVDRKVAQDEAAASSQEAQRNLRSFGYVDASGRPPSPGEMQVLFLLRVVRPSPAAEAIKSPASGKAGS